MLCERCHNAEAVVQVSTILHAGQSMDQRCLCSECAAGGSGGPWLIPPARSMAPVSERLVLSYSPTAKARVQSVEDRLGELDPLLQRFCADHGYGFHASSEPWPARAVHMPVCQGLVRSLHLTTGASLVEILKRGFYPEMPWSLFACAFLASSACPDGRRLTAEVFLDAPFSGLLEVLADRLEQGNAILAGWTPEVVMARGEIPGRGAPPFKGCPW